MNNWVKNHLGKSGSGAQKRALAEAPPTLDLTPLLNVVTAPAKVRKRSAYDEYRSDPAALPQTNWSAPEPKKKIWSSRNTKVAALWKALTGEERKIYEDRARDMNRMNTGGAADAPDEDPEAARARYVCDYL